MTDNVPVPPTGSTTQLMRDARGAFDRAYRAHTEWRGSIIEDDRAAAKAVVEALDEVLETLTAARAAIAEWIKRGESHA